VAEYDNIEIDDKEVDLLITKLNEEQKLIFCHVTNILEHQVNHQHISCHCNLKSDYVRIFCSGVAGN